ncbi:MAG: 1-deoxy-D-xylulose-5-phosphate synthase [Clostridia bacterium]|nr:1-deoxy-D-xylulose-5-phosphate synthase [Clostridia bacterium]
MEQFDKWPLLGSISSPADLKALPADKMGQLASEIRDYLVFRVSENGGHLASNLGVVELTLAIHRAFDSPKDHIIFDVGHQSYVHKLLTGRKEAFDTLRQAGGISGFTKRAESPHDAFGAGHSSTSISAAIGMAEAEYRKGSDAWTVAVIGDGALSGGLAYEGLNNCARHLRLIVIVNENEMSISPNTGRLARHLSKLRVSHNYLKTKEFTASALRHIPLLGRPIYKLLRFIKRRIKHVFYKENLFEHMDIRYRGPVEGGDAAGLEALLRHAKRLGTSVILHVKTKKGQGYAPAEQDPNTYHSLSPRKKVPNGATFSETFGEELTRLAEQDERICAITAAMSCGTGLEAFHAARPKQFYDVGIAEGHAVTFAAGLAAGGLRPVVAVYSTFLQRAYDNLLHDAALQDLPTVLCIDRAGLNPGDGPTHHGIFDVAILSEIPDAHIYTPVTRSGLCRSLQTALALEKGISAIRYPNGTEDPDTVAAFYGTKDDRQELGVRAWGDAADKARITVVTHGRIVAEALQAARQLRDEGVPTRVLLCEYIAPYGNLASELAPMLGGDLILLEEELRQGGFGMNLADALERCGALAGRKRVIMGTENGFLAPSAGQTVFAAAGIDAASVVQAAQNLIKKEGQ